MYLPNRVKKCIRCVEDAEKSYELGNERRAKSKAQECLKYIKGAMKVSQKYFGGRRRDIDEILEDLLSRVEKLLGGKVEKKSSSYSEKEEKKEEELPIIRPSLKFSDLVGLEKIRETILTRLKLFLEHPEIVRQLKMRPPKGMLLFGPPGCGKTTIAKALAGEFGFPLIVSSASAILSKRRGESEKKVREMFELARKNAPSVILIDEVDALVPAESTEHTRRLEGEFLQNLDGALSSQDRVVIVVMTTNYPRRLSPALVRPGRVDNAIYLPPPNKEIRKALFKHALKELPKENIDYEYLAKATAPALGMYYSHASIVEIVEAAKNLAAMEALEAGSGPKIKMEHLIKAINMTHRTISEEDLRRYLERAHKHSAIIPYEKVDRSFCTTFRNNSMDAERYFDEKMREVERLEVMIRKLYAILNRRIKEAHRALSIGDRFKAALAYKMAKTIEKYIQVMRIAEYQVMATAIEPILKDVKDIIDEAKKTYEEIGMDLHDIINGVESLINTTVELTLDVEKELMQTIPPEKVRSLDKEIKESIGEDLTIRGVGYGAEEGKEERGRT